MSKDYLQKELSWLAFNERVLQEAADKANPLIERVRFLGIYANNLDEFYKVQFADLKRTLLIEQEQGLNTAHTSQLIKQINQKVLASDRRFDSLYNDLLLEMARNQIFLVNERQLTSYQESWIRDYFKRYLRPHITPILLDSHSEPIRFLRDDNTYLAVEIITDNGTQYALLEVPTDKVSRFVLLPSVTPNKNQSIIFLDNILRYCLPDIFNIFFDATALNAYSFKITRDAEYDISYELETSLLELMSSGLKKRLTAEPVRFTYQKDMPKALMELLMEKLKISSNEALPGSRYPNFRDLIYFPSINRKQLYKPLPSLTYQRFKQHRNMFATIKQQDVLLYYPYYTFEHTLELLRQASFDPAVISVRINIYRVAKDSQIIESMIDAANNGKKVTVVVELQARFDEEANIHWAKRLTEAGVKVIFSPPRLKIHAKLFLIDRKEDGEIVRYAHIGSGNFNEKTARVYTDFSLLTADKRITDEVRRVFHFIEEPYRPVTFTHLLVSPQNTRQCLGHFIDHEIANAKAGKAAGIYLKVNNLTDHALIDKLYHASQQGVPIRIIVRGMCCLIPNQPGLSDNITVTSIIDRFLEHARVYIFENNGQKETYISSADWMPRNLNHRIEVGVRIFDATVKQTIQQIFDIQAADNVKARKIDRDLSNSYVPRGNKKKVRSQIALYDYLQQLESQIATDE